MSAEQISQLVLDLYAARPEAKEYLDFYVSPDINRKLDKARISIKKEMQRMSRGRNRTRSSRVRRIIRDIASLDPGPEAVCEIMTYAIETACSVGSRLWMKESTQRALAKLLQETINVAGRNGFLDVCLPRMRVAVESMDTASTYAGEFKHLLSETMDETIGKM